MNVFYVDLQKNMDDKVWFQITVLLIYTNN